MALAMSSPLELRSFFRVVTTSSSLKIWLHLHLKHERFSWSFLWWERWVEFFFCFDIISSHHRLYCIAYHCVHIRSDSWNRYCAGKETWLSRILPKAPANVFYSALTGVLPWSIAPSARSSAWRRQSDSYVRLSAGIEIGLETERKLRYSSSLYW